MTEQADLARWKAELKHKRAQLGRVYNPSRLPTDSYDGYWVRETEDRVRALRRKIIIAEGGSLAPLLERQKQLKGEIAERRAELQRLTRRIRMGVVHYFGSIRARDDPDYKMDDERHRRARSAHMEAR